MLDSTAQASTSDLKGVPIPEIETLDLTSHSVLAHFAKSTRNVQLLNFLLALDRVDKWAVDYNESESPKALEIQLFVQDLQRFVEASLPVLHRVPREFADILCHLTTTRCMYLIRFVGQHNEEFWNGWASCWKKRPDNHPCRSRQAAFGSVQQGETTGEIFSGKRLTRILQIMGSYSDV
ncbi:hypothetical protein [Aeromonas veronii]|uniref:hypothetical protein n=1 Tax=Aeromonas veronii TaxID=654 RepID=UPI001F0A4D6A|nr:hypothetical protein [Aeromonas veronii]